MALTPAERAARYRKKLKEDPVKYEAQRKKQLERLKKNKKNISQLSEEEKKKKRQQWRDQKRKQKLNRKQTEKQQQSQPKNENNTKTSSLKIKLKKVKNSYLKSEKKITQLQTTISRLRKQLFRIKVKHEKEVNTLKEGNAKLQARHEILELSLKEKYKQCQSTEEKKLLRSIANTKSAKEKKGSQVIAKCLGLKGKIRFSNKKKYFSKKIEEEMTLFYERDDISRCTAGKKEFKSKKGEKKQIRYLVDTLYNLFKIYKAEDGKYSFSTFYKYKPYYVLLPTNKLRDTCLCVKHCNFKFLFDVLQKKSILLYKTIKDLIINITCDENSYSCMYNTCDKCKCLKIEYQPYDLDIEFTWCQWERESKSYIKSGVVQTTKVTKKNLKSGTLAVLISQFENQLKTFRTHYYNVNEQQKQYRKCVKNLNENEIAILCDFSENIDCKLAHEVQSMHFGGSKNTISLHTGMIFGNNKCQSFTTLSDDTCHEPHAIWAHLFPVLKYAKSLFGNFRVIHFFSDGPSSQYRQKKNFFLLNYFVSKLQLDYATWNFSESGHGKGIADGIGGSVKRTLDRQVLYGNDIVDASDALRLLETSMKVVKCFYVSSSDIVNIKKLIMENIIAVRGTMQIHQIITKNARDYILHRHLSCFCSFPQGLCLCLNPTKHEFTKMATLNHVKLSKLNNPPVPSNEPDNQKKLDETIDYAIPLDSVFDNSVNMATHFENNNSIDSEKNKLYCSRRYDADITIEPIPRKTVHDPLQCKLNSETELPIGLYDVNELPVTLETDLDDINLPNTINTSLTKNITTETNLAVGLPDSSELRINDHIDLDDIDIELPVARFTNSTPETNFLVSDLLLSPNDNSCFDDITIASSVVANSSFTETKDCTSTLLPINSYNVRKVENSSPSKELKPEIKPRHNLNCSLQKSPNTKHKSSIDPKPNNKKPLKAEISNRKRIHVLSDITIYPNKKKAKTITINKSNRKFFCPQCKISYPFKLHEMINCKLCKVWTCMDCASKPVQFPTRPPR